MKAFFGKIYQYWMAFGLAIGVVMTPIQLFLVYTLGFGLGKLFVLLTGKDLLDRRMRAAASYWHEKPGQPKSLEEARHQF